MEGPVVLLELKKGTSYCGWEKMVWEYWSRKNCVRVLLNMKKE